ncbi:MAG: hypothetical protein HY334_03780 [Armatimonadetes bacterium]|nr:hypothetical protein [Armatimonadota bacterium]
MRRIRGAWGWLAAAAVLLIVPGAAADYHSTGNPPAQASGAEAELRTAIQHAKTLAAGASGLSGITQHLQHTINCLEGPAGRHFSGAAGDPCRGMGRGVLIDAKGKAGAIFLARQADDLAVETVAVVKDVPTARAAARSVAFLLEQALGLLK